jgi:hypothetical protein
MNIIYIKQAVKTKVNKRDTVKAVESKLAEMLGEKEGTKLKTAIINTSEIPNVQGGGSVLLASNESETKFIAISIGASTKDILCVTDDGKESNYSFEYAMLIDKKVFNGISIDNVLDNIEDNQDLLEALTIIGSIATNGRYAGLISGNYGEVNDTDTKCRYHGVSFIDYKNTETMNDIETEVLGRKGKLHLLQVVPLLQNELDVLRYLDDSAMTEVISLNMVKDNKATFNNRKKSFNFINIFNKEHITDAVIEELGLKKDKSGELNITKETEVAKLVDKLYGAENNEK